MVSAILGSVLPIAVALIVVVGIVQSNGHRNEENRHVDTGSGETIVLREKRRDSRNYKKATPDGSLEDRDNDWLASQLREERRSGNRMSDMFDLKEEHANNCDAYAIKREHERNCGRE